MQVVLTDLHCVAKTIYLLQGRSRPRSCLESWPWAYLPERLHIGGVGQGVSGAAESGR